MEAIVEIRHLRTLLALEETGNLSLAAKRLFLTQSALSHQIRVLEEYFETPLFERKTTPVRFTPTGDRLLRLAKDMLPMVAHAERDIMQLLDGASGELRVAVECHTCFDWLMPAMDCYRNAWPSVELDIVSGFHVDPVALLLSHRSDIAIVSNNEEQNGVVYRPLFEYEMVGIAAKNHALASKSVWQAADFQDETLITYPVPDEMLDLMRKVLLPKGINPARRNSELTIAIIQLVASRRGVATLPYWTVMPYLEKGYVNAHQVTDSGLHSQLYAAIREEDANKAYLENFCQMVRDLSFATLPGLSPLVD